MPAKTIRHHSTSTSDTSSESSATTEEDDEKTRMHSTVNGRSQVYDLITQEDITHDLASEGQAEYEAVSPDDKVAKSMDEEDTAYTQESLMVQVSTSDEHIFIFLLLLGLSDGLEKFLQSGGLCGNRARTIQTDARLNHDHQTLRSFEMEELILGTP